MSDSARHGDVELAQKLYVDTVFDDPALALPEMRQLRCARTSRRPWTNYENEVPSCFRR